MAEQLENKKRTSFLQRLRKDTTGNTFVMAAVALFPIAGLIGGGVDIGRAYMAKARLQQACDAGALAGRRNMTQDTMTAADKAEAVKFFNFNFPEGSFASTDFDDTITDADGNIISENGVSFVDGSDPRVVVGKAQTTIKTTLMKIFGFQNLVIKASCSSRLDVGNVDVMMVLDVTGSMGNSITGGGTRLDALKDSVKTFYDILGPGGGASGEQIRYGFVPYSSAVNVGEILYDADPTWLAGGAEGDTWTYQTRRGTWQVPNPDYVAPDPDYDPRTDPGASPISTTNSTTYETLTYVDGPECTDMFSENQSVPGWWTANPSGNPLESLDTSGEHSVLTTVTYHYHSWDGSNANPPGYAVGSSYWRTCERRVQTQVKTYEKQGGNGEPEFITVNKWQSDAVSFSGWEYGQFTHDVYDYVRSIKSTNPATQNPTINGSDLQRWDGCIEERTTDSSITTATTSIPDTALDLQIDILPTDAASRWGPFWRDVMYERSNSTTGNAISKSGDAAACPPAARKLASYATYDDGTGNDLESYINGFTDQGFTNHAIGMIWGARLLSDTGLFAAENSTSANGFSIGRHIVFMTDGFMDIRPWNYDSYGLASLDSRIAAAGTGETDLEDLQEHRFKLMCSAAKSKGWTIWVVQLGSSSTVSTTLENCASSPDHATTASDKASLVDAFGDIAQKIGGLRLDN